MKVIIVLLVGLIGFLFFAGIAYGVEQVFTVDLRGLELEAKSGEYEWKVSEDMSRSIQGLFWNRKMVENGEDVELSIMAMAVGTRKYLGGDVFDGIYIGAYGTGASISVKSPQDAKAISVGISGSLGLKWVSDNGTALDFGVSLGVPVLTHIVASEISLDEVVTFGPRGVGFTLGLGYAW